MFNEIRLANALVCNISNEFVYYVELVEAWENKLLGILHYVRNLLLGLCFTIVEENVVHNDVSHVVLL